MLHGCASSILDINDVVWGNRLLNEGDKVAEGFLLSFEFGVFCLVGVFSCFERLVSYPVKKKIVIRYVDYPGRLVFRLDRGSLGPRYEF